MTHTFKIAGIAVAVLASMLAGCASLNQERALAESLMGKNISVALAEMRPRFGSPMLVSQREVGRPDHSYYLWVRHTGAYTHTSPTGNVYDTSTGVPTVISTYQTTTTQQYCQVSMEVNQAGIVDYYEVHGCAGELGIGNTGMLHRYGIN